MAYQENRSISAAEAAPAWIQRELKVMRILLLEEEEKREEMGGVDHEKTHQWSHVLE